MRYINFLQFTNGNLVLFDIPQSKNIAPNVAQIE